MSNQPQQYIHQISSSSSTSYTMPQKGQCSGTNPSSNEMVYSALQFGHSKISVYQHNFYKSTTSHPPSPEERVNSCAPIV